MTTVVVKPSKNKTEFSEIKIGTFFISTASFISTSSDVLYLKTGDEEVYSFEIQCVIHLAYFFDGKNKTPEDFFDEPIKPINVKLTVKEHENDFISYIKSSGNSSMKILTPTSNPSVVRLGDFFKNSYDQLSLKVSSTEYFNFNTGETNVMDNADLKKFLLLDVEILCIL